MKILHLITGLGIGGTEKHLLRLLPLMKNTTHIACSLRSNNETGKKLEAQGIKVYYLSNNKGIFKNASLVRNFKQIIKDEKPDILCTYLIHADLFGRLFGRLFGIKKIICNIRVVFNKGYLNEVGKLPLLLERISSHLNTEYIANSNTAKQSLIKAQKIDAGRIKVIPNGIDLQKIMKISMSNANKAAKRASIGMKSSDFIIVCVGRLHEQKGQKYLIEAISILSSKHKNIKCLLLMDGEKRAEYESQIKSLGIEDKIKLLGHREDAIEILKASDLFVLPTNYEGMSNALLDAMACAMPIITTDIPENKELIANGRQGLLVEPRNSKKLSEAIESLMTDKQKRMRLAKNAFAEIKKYDMKICADKFEKEYLRVGKQD